jgi:hypothetical protein
MDSFISIAIVLTFLTAFFLLVRYYFSTVERRSKEALEAISEGIRWQQCDVKIWFKGYDMLKKRSTFRIDPFKMLYSYNVADLYVSDDKLIVVGKDKIFGRTRILSPLIICTNPSDLREKSLKCAKSYIATELVGDDLEIQFEDFEYSNNIKLVVKNIGQELNDMLKASANNRIYASVAGS